jgi:hypothetical protein
LPVNAVWRSFDNAGDARSYKDTTMKRLRYAALTAAAAFMLGAGFSASAYNAESCRLCATAFRACVAATGDIDECYFQYERCIYRNGCPG